MIKLLDFLEKLAEDKQLLTEPIMPDMDIEYLSYSSRDVKQRTLFICKGAGFKPEYLADAVKGGAVCYVSEKKYDIDLPCVLVRDIGCAMSVLAMRYYNYPSRKLKTIAVTGTKGKSTTSYYIKSIIDTWQKSIGGAVCAIVSSIDTFDGKESFESHNTTPESLDLQRHMANAVESGIEYFVCETSSQALKYGRVHGLIFDFGVFLNISEDHISPVEHTDFDDYFGAKLKIFSMSRQAAYNVGADHIEKIADVSRETLGEVNTFGADKKADIEAYDIGKKGLSTVFKVRGLGIDAAFSLCMPGLFNVDNALAAISAAHAIGAPVSAMVAGLAQAKASGRMEVFSSRDNNKIVIVDYAHNYLSFLTLYESVKKEYPGRQIVTVFGAPGGKAATRRRDLGMLSGIYCDKIYLTEEDAANEPVQKISEDIAEYARRNCDNIFLIDNRDEAIERAVLESDGASVILVTGKGAETTQKRPNGYEEITTDVDNAKHAIKIYDTRPILVKN